MSQPRLELQTCRREDRSVHLTRDLDLRELLHWLIIRLPWICRWLLKELQHILGNVCVNLIGYIFEKLRGQNWRKGGNWNSCASSEKPRLHAVWNPNGFSGIDLNHDCMFFQPRFHNRWRKARKHGMKPSGSRSSIDNGLNKKQSQRMLAGVAK